MTVRRTGRDGHRDDARSGDPLSTRDRWPRSSRRSALVWLTGLPASGKTTLATGLERALLQRRIATFVLDGDAIRTGLNRDLGYSPEHRHENLRRVGEVARMLVEAGILTIAAFISPYAADRALVRGLLQPGEFVEIWCTCDLAVCEARDPKGLYRKARAGELPEFTGVSAPYEAPRAPEVVVETDRLTIAQSVAAIVRHLEQRGIIAALRQAP